MGSSVESGEIFLTHVRFQYYEIDTEEKKIAPQRYYFI